MRIALVYDGAYPWIKGGVEKRLHEIGKGLVKRGHEVHWYCVGWWLNENRNRDIEVDGINYHAVCGPMEMYVNGRRSIKAAIKFSLSLFRPLLRNKFDIIDCQQFPFFPCFISKLVSVIRGSIFIMTVHEYWGPYWYEYLGKIKGLFGRLIEKLTFKLTDNVITISNYVKSTLDFYNGKIYVVPNGVQFDRIRMLRKKGKKSNLIFVGRLIKHKNVDILLRAMDILKRRGFSFKCF
ncbi:MAG: glycosyltransferase family 4 protein, partial [Methanobacteriales archaeon]|nr:glycosyltransferase family 4 protein [Methanobacteriales archaeon]